MTRCTKCGRKLKRPTQSGMGRVCEMATVGTKPKRQPSQPVRDERTADMFADDLSYARRVDALLSAVSLEMR